MTGYASLGLAQAASRSLRRGTAVAIIAPPVDRRQRAAETEHPADRQAHQTIEKLKNRHATKAAG